jgi:tRNA(adenine34) deaminase
VSLEPCAMCAAAASVARIESVRFAAEDPKGGGILHGARIFTHPTCHHRREVLSGMGEAESADLLRRFFAERRG